MTTTDIGIDTREFEEAVKGAKNDLGLELMTVIRWQMGLWCRDIILKVYADPKASLAQQRKMGRNAIYGDLLGSKRAGGSLFAPLKKDIKSVWFNRKADARMIITRKGQKFSVDDAHYLPSATEATIYKIHQDHRDGKGRVRVTEKDRTSNGIRIQNVFYVPAEVLKSYIKSVQDRVGRGKSTWMNAYSYFKGKVSKYNLLPWSPSEWINRHNSAVSGMGGKSEQYMMSTMSGMAVSSSNAEYGIDPKNIIERTMETRRKDLQGPNVMKRFQGRMDKYNAKQSRAA